MQICFHKIKNQIQIFIILCSDQILQTDNVRVPIKLSQEDHLSKSSLSICRILKCIKHFFDSNNIFGLFIDRFPYHSVSALA